MHIYDFFPQLLGKTVKEVNLNDEAEIYLKNIGVLDKKHIWLNKNPLIIAEECQRFLNDLHQKYQIEFSYGGYQEDRNILWHDTYLDQLGFWTHLGIDVNIPSGTQLFSPINADVIVSDHDKDHPDAPQNHGWGNRLILKPEYGDYALILAHLSQDTHRAIGQKVQEGELLGTIGTSIENGGWFEHFHIQAVSLSYLNTLIKNNQLGMLDGYCPSDSPDIEKLYPNPFVIF